LALLELELTSTHLSSRSPLTALLFTLRPEFHDLPLPLLRLALSLLAKQGKAQVFKGTTGEDGQEEGEGVKFV
jgi:hypothetical protein